jgi:hypothetical protein
LKWCLKKSKEVKETNLETLEKKVVEQETLEVPWTKCPQDQNLKTKLIMNKKLSKIKNVSNQCVLWLRILHIPLLHIFHSTPNRFRYSVRVKTETLSLKALKKQSAKMISLILRSNHNLITPQSPTMHLNLNSNCKNTSSKRDQLQSR